MQQSLSPYTIILIAPVKMKAIVSEIEYLDIICHHNINFLHIHTHTITMQKKSMCTYAYVHVTKVEMCIY